MTRRYLCRGLLSATIVIGSMGCETTRSFLHHDKDDDSADKKGDGSDTSKIRSVDSDDKDPRPFFKSDRLPSAMSSQARDIERDLGIQ